MLQRSSDAFFAKSIALIKIDFFNAFGVIYVSLHFQWGIIIDCASLSDLMSVSCIEVIPNHDIFSVYLKYASYFSFLVSILAWTSIPISPSSSREYYSL